MIPIDSKSYPYLAVAQACSLPYKQLLELPIEEIYEKQKNIKRLGNEIFNSNIVDNHYAREIWNAAIEKAAELADEDHGSYCEEVGNKIRNLKIK